MFANEDFIEASRKYVCIRIETFENKEAEEKVRALLNGRYANTAFCIFDPQGEEKLTRSGRGPLTALGFRGRGRVEDETVIRQMKEVAAQFKPGDNQGNALLQDFNSFRQALNVASADQRLLIFVDVKEDDKQQVEDNLKQVFGDSEITGKFHLNFMDAEVDKGWSKKIHGETASPGIFIIRSGTYGQDGMVMDRLKHSSSAEEIKTAMTAANEKFASLEDRKTYSEHVRSGRRNGIYFENEMSNAEASDRRKGRRNGNRRGGRNR